MMYWGTSDSIVTVVWGTQGDSWHRQEDKINTSSQRFRQSWEGIPQQERTVLWKVPVHADCKGNLDNEVVKSPPFQTATARWDESPPKWLAMEKGSGKGKNWIPETITRLLFLGLSFDFRWKNFFVKAEKIVLSLKLTVLLGLVTGNLSSQPLELWPLWLSYV